MPVTINGTSGITTPGIDASGTNKFATTIGVGGATPSASGAGITFPATQSSSSDANTLDDYEEGTFTPTWTGGTITAVNFCAYTKVGRLINVMYDLQLGSSSSGSLSGFTLPFTPSPSTFYAGSFNYNSGSTTQVINIDAGVVSIRASVNAGSVTSAQVSGYRLIFNVTYFG